MEELNSSMEMSTRRKEVEELVREKFPDVFAENPGRTDVIEYDILLKDTLPIKQPAYRVPYAVFCPGYLVWWLDFTLHLLLFIQYIHVYTQFCFSSLYMYYLRGD